MSYRVQCSACGKTMTLEDDAAGELLVCVACGTRLVAPPAPLVQAMEAQDGGATPDAAADATEVPSAVAAPAYSTAPSALGRAPAARRTPSTANGRTVIVAGVVALVALLLASLVVVSVLISRRGAHSAMAEDVKNNADLLALKSEAESLAIQGRLAEAHEKYRRLQQFAVGRDIKDPLFWDIMERAKVDQDKVYTMLLNQMAPAVPDPRPGVIGPDGYPRNNGSAAAPTTAPREGAETDPSLPSGGYPARFGGSDASGAEPPGSAQPTKAPVGAADEPPARDPTTVRPASQPRAVPTTSTTPPTYGVTDAQVGDALKHGVDFLIPLFADGQLVRQQGYSEIKQAGLNALCVYALLTTGQATRDPRLDVRGEFITKLVETMKRHDLRTAPDASQQPVTYARSLRAAALAVNNRPEDAKVLKEDVNWLVGASMSGAYTYDDRFTKAPSPGAQSRAELTSDEPLAVTWSDGWYGSGDDGAAVIPVHGAHDPRTGRELGYPGIRRPGYGIPMDTRTPLPAGPGFPRTRQPAPIGPNTTMPPGGYGGGWAEPPDIPLPERPDSTPSPSTVRFPWDNSNSQYGLLGVWSGAEVGVEVPVRYWKDVEKHWTSYQLRSGEWGYKEAERTGTLAMTCGGLASLFVTHDWLAAPMVKGTVGRDPLTRNMAAALAWLEREDHCIDLPTAKSHYLGYDLYGLERVGLASGYKYFGPHDWYRELATKMVASQWPNGAWGRGQDGPDTVIDTAYTLLFLSRGRHPILMNKLRFDRSDVVRVDGKPSPGYWANRPRDLANLTRFASRQLERGLNWQVVSLDVEWSDWLDSPVLFIASHQAPALSDADYEKLRGFIEAGGLLFTHADTGAGAFNRWVAKLVERVCPGYALQDLPEDHLLYSTHYKIKSPKPRLQAVSNGSRLLIVHSPTDLATNWQQRGEKVYPDTFRVAVNLFLYAAGKVDLRNRLSTSFVPETTADPEGRLQVARLKYAGNWDPEPGAWSRFRRVFEWDTKIALEHPPVELKDLKYGTSAEQPETEPATAEGAAEPPTAGQAGSPASVTIAHLTGNARYTFTDAEVASIKSFVESGGTLIIDPCGGSNAFAESVRETLLDKAFPGIKPEPVPADHPLLRRVGATESLSLKPRPYVSEALPGGAPELRVLNAGKGHVVISPLDVTSGLLGTNTWGIVGYDPATCAQLMSNALLWSRTSTQ